MSVLVYTENWDGKFKKSSFELLSFASRIAEMQSSDLIAVSIGDVADNELQKLAAYGADKILKIAGNSVLDNKSHTRIIADIAKDHDAKVLVLAHNNTGKALAPRLTVRLGAALGTGLTALPVSFEPFLIRKKVFSGKAFANQELKADVKVLTLAQNSFELIEKQKDVNIEEISPAMDEVHTKLIDRDKVSGKIILTDAEIVVSGGRGMKSSDNWGPIEELAEILEGATACSRPVSDEGWRPHGEHTGQTGKIIAPNLYFAIGISGAIQHLAGVSSSKVIVAINNDADAPIFEAADYGIIGDAQKVLPKLVEAVKVAKAK